MSTANKNKKTKRQYRSGENGRLEVRRDLETITPNQDLAGHCWSKNKNLMMLGTAGTGKTFLALWFALAQMMDRDSEYRKVYIVRSAVPTRDIGFLPGNAREKTKVYEAPYYNLCSEIFGRGDAYDILKGKNWVEFITTSNIRGTTMDDAIIIVDECQNMSFHELDSIITRPGINTKVVFCGDTKQDDLTSERKKETSGLRNFVRIIDNMEEFETVTFTVDDIVRSDLVRSYIIQKELLGF